MITQTSWYDKGQNLWTGLNKSLYLESTHSYMFIPLLYTPLYDKLDRSFPISMDWISHYCLYKFKYVHLDIGQYVAFNTYYLHGFSYLQCVMRVLFMTILWRTGIYKRPKFRSNIRITDRGRLLIAWKMSIKFGDFSKKYLSRTLLSKRGSVKYEISYFDHYKSASVEFCSLYYIHDPLIGLA